MHRCIGCKKEQVVDYIDDKPVYETREFFLVFRTIEKELKLLLTDDLTETFPLDPYLWGKSPWDWDLGAIEMVVGLIQFFQCDMEAGNESPSIREKEGAFKQEVVHAAVWQFLKEDYRHLEASGRSKPFDIRVVDVNVEMKIK